MQHLCQVAVNFFFSRKKLLSSSPTMNSGTTLETSQDSSVASGQPLALSEPPGKDEEDGPGGGG